MKIGCTSVDSALIFYSSNHSKLNYWGRDLNSLKDFNIKFHNGGLLNEHKNSALPPDTAIKRTFY